MSEWKTIRLREICDSIDYGLTASASTDALGSKFLRITDIVGPTFDWATVPYVDVSSSQKEKYRLHDGDIVIARTGATTGASRWIANPPDAVFASYLVRLKISDDVDSRFVGYLLKSDQFWTYVRGVLGDKSAQPNASATTLTNAPVRIPAVQSVQRAIAEVLGVLDDKIAVNERIISRQVQLVSALFICAVREPGCSQVLATEVFDFDFGLPFASSHFNSDGKGMPLLRIRDLRTFTPQVFTTQRLTNDVVVQPGDVVAGMDAEFRPSIWLGEPALLNQRVLRCRSRVGGGNSFVVEALRQPLLEIENSKTGTTVIHLNKTDLDRAKVALPSLSALHIFEMKSEPLRLSIVNRARENKALAELRDALLPGLISGVIRVRDAEKAVEELT